MHRLTRSGVVVFRFGGAEPSGVASPFCRLSDHTLPITAINIGLGIFPQLRIISASEDNTVKVTPHSP